MMKQDERKALIGKYIKLSRIGVLISVPPCTTHFSLQTH